MAWSPDVPGRVPGPRRGTSAQSLESLRGDLSGTCTSWVPPSSLVTFHTYNLVLRHSHVLLFRDNDKETPCVLGTDADSEARCWPTTGWRAGVSLAKAGQRRRQLSSAQGGGSGLRRLLSPEAEIQVLLGLGLIRGPGPSPKPPCLGRTHLAARGGWHLRPLGRGLASRSRSEAACGAQPHPRPPAGAQSAGTDSSHTCRPLHLE